LSDTGTDDANSEDGEDDAYKEAKNVVMRYQKASASFLQQIMGIGYPKAAKIIMKLEERGIIGPQNGAKPRAVYVQDGMDGDDSSETEDDDMNQMGKRDTDGQYFDL